MAAAAANTTNQRRCCCCIGRLPHARMRTGYHVTSSARFRRATRSGGRTHRRSRHVTNARPYHRRHGDAACPHNNFSTSPIRRIQSAVSPLGGANENNLLVGDKGVRSMIWRELLDTVKARKLAYYGHTMRKQGSCLEKEIMQGKLPGARRLERHERPGWTTSRRGQDSPWNSQSE